MPDRQVGKQTTLAYSQNVIVTVNPESGWVRGSSERAQSVYESETVRGFGSPLRVRPPPTASPHRREGLQDRSAQPSTVAGKSLVWWPDRGWGPIWAFEQGCLESETARSCARSRKSRKCVFSQAKNNVLIQPFARGICVVAC